MSDKEVMLDGNVISIDTLQETRNNLKNSERIVETSEGNFETVTRIKE